MKSAQQLNWLKQNYEQTVSDLAALVAIPSISTDGDHQKEIGDSAALTAEQMKAAGLQNVEVLSTGKSNPYAYGEWLGAPGKPTVFLYAHHDVQPINFVDQWKQADPWKLTRRAGRLYGRGAADDKAAISAQLASISAYLQTEGALPVNIKMLVEGEEEIGSANLLGFFKQHARKIQSDVIVVNDTENVETGLPSLTYSLRGIVELLVEVETAKIPVHSGMAGGNIPDAAIALNVILSRLYWKNGKIPVPGLYDRVRKPTAFEKKQVKSLPYDVAKLRKAIGMVPGSVMSTPKMFHPFEQEWLNPAVTVIAQEASSIRGASNQVLPKASAIVSCRIVADQKPEEVERQLRKLLSAEPPWGAKVTVRHNNSVKWWRTETDHPAFQMAMAAMKDGYGRDAVAIGSGGSIGFVGPLSELFGGAPALLIGIEDPHSQAHAPNESLHEGDFKKVMASLVSLYARLGTLPVGKSGARGGKK